MALGGALVSCFAPTSGGGPASHFYVQFNSTNVTIDCTKYDSNQTTYSSSLVTSGGQSQSTSETFGVYLPNSATALRDPAALTRYPIANGFLSGSDAPYPFEIQFTLYDPPAPEPNQEPGWDSCAPGSCGTPNPDPDHYHQVTSITEQSSNTPGMATFRVSGSFVALVTKTQGGADTATATGDWSMVVTVPDPGQ